jgi:hypothetical protein
LPLLSVTLTDSAKAELVVDERPAGRGGAAGGGTCAPAVFGGATGGGACADRTVPSPTATALLRRSRLMSTYVTTLSR